MNLEINAEPYYSRTFLFYILPVLLFNEICFEDFRLEVLNLFSTYENLIKQGFQHLFVPTSNVYLHSENGPGFYVRTILYE